ncbi:MAG: Trk system potassium transporter TrkA, partial [Saezia sp.]
MKIIIVGAGRVGESVAENLLSEDNEITIIDTNIERLRDLEERFDLRGVQGNAADIETLREAGAEDTEMLVSCASIEETNLVVCKLAQMVFNIPTRIARVKASHLEHRDILQSKDGFAIDAIICPEESLSQYINTLVEYPQALQVRNFANGLACLISVQARSGSPFVRRTISEIRQIAPAMPVRIVAIYRRLWDGPDQLMLTDANTRIEPDDQVFVLAAKEHLPAILDGFHQYPNSVFQTEEDFTKKPENYKKNSHLYAQRIIIAGGGRVGERLAMQLSHSAVNHNIKIIEKDHERCIALASKLHESILVLHGNVTDEELLESENVSKLDLFISVTHDDESNIMSALLAKRLGARRVIALINRRSYAELMHNTQIDIALSPAQTMLGELLTHVRHGEVRAVHSLRRGIAEALEIVARGTRKTSHVIDRTIGELD